MEAASSAGARSRPRVILDTVRDIQMSPWCLDGFTLGASTESFIDLEQLFGSRYCDRMPRLNSASGKMIMLLFCGEAIKRRHAPREELDESGLDILAGRAAAGHGAGTRRG